jgi:6-pyruvoyl-tetrahydropterin synthase
MSLCNWLLNFHFLINRNDKTPIDKNLVTLEFESDPTAEVLARFIAERSQVEISKYDKRLNVMSVTIWESENSRASYIKT